MGDALQSLTLLNRGKGKDLYEIPGHPDFLLQVMRNSLSTHNIVHLSEIPGKGELINCSRMARMGDMKVGVEPPFLDKERFRKIAIVKWNGGPKVPLEFNPREIRDGLVGYHEAFEQITSMNLEDFRAQYYD